MKLKAANIRFPIRLKLLVSSLILLIPLGFVAYFLVSSYRSQTDFANLELQGARVTNAIATVAGSLSIWTENPVDNENSDAIGNAIKHLSDETNAFKDSLGITSAALTKAGLDPQLPTKIENSWNTIKRLAPDQRFDELGKLQANLLDYNGFIADVSNLILDPDLDSYNSMTASILTLPSVIGHLNRIQAAFLQYNAGEPDSLKELVIANAFLNESDVPQTVKAVKTTIRSDADSYGATPGLVDPSANELKAFIEAAKAFEVTLRTLNGSRLDSQSQANIRDLWQNTNVAAQKLQVKTQNIMGLQIQKRIAYYNAQLLFILILCGTTVLLALFVILRLTHSTSHALERISQLAGDIAAGRQTQKSSTENNENAANGFSRRIVISSHDEVGQLGEHFNKLLEMLEDLLKRIETNATGITDMVQGLSAASQEISATANEQAAAVKEIVSTIEDTNHLSKSVSTRVEEVSRIASDTKKSVEAGFTAVRESIDKMSEIFEANAKTITGINFLGDKIKNIWDIVNIINSVADQTKIIAFNAELEASSAGDAGKNFQIVASEIRRLADSTVNSTNEIKVRIQEIERSSDALLLASEQGTQRILQGKDLSQQVNKLFGDISAAADISDSSTQAIAMSIRQQVGSFDQIVIAIKQISQGVDNFVVATKSTSVTTESLRKMATSLKALMQKFETKVE